MQARKKQGGSEEKQGLPKTELGAEKKKGSPEKKLEAKKKKDPPKQATLKVKQLEARRARKLFDEYFEARKELDKHKDNAELEIKIEALNGEIIKLLKTDFASSISQKDLIEWCKYNLQTVDKEFSIVHSFSGLPTQQKDFVNLFARPKFLDRLLLGKGSNEYKEGSKASDEQAKIGKEFVENLFKSGPTEVKDTVKDEVKKEGEDEVDEKSIENAPPPKPKSRRKFVENLFKRAPTEVNDEKEVDEKSTEDASFPKLKYSVGMARLYIGNYLSSSNFNEAEQVHIKAIDAAAAEALKINWSSLHKYINLTVYNNEDAKLVIKRIIYEDLKLKIKAEQKNEDDLAPYQTLLDKYPTFDDFLRGAQSGNPEHEKLKAHIDSMADQYLSESYNKEEVKLNRKRAAYAGLKVEAEKKDGSMFPFCKTLLDKCPTFDAFLEKDFPDEISRKRAIYDYLKAKADQEDESIPVFYKALFEQYPTFDAFSEKELLDDDKYQRLKKHVALEDDNYQRFKRQINSEADHYLSKSYNNEEVKLKRKRLLYENLKAKAEKNDPDIPALYKDLLKKYPTFDEFLKNRTPENENHQHFEKYINEEMPLQEQLKKKHLLYGNLKAKAEKGDVGMAGSYKDLFKQYPTFDEFLKHYDHSDKKHRSLSEYIHETTMEETITPENLAVPDIALRDPHYEDLFNTIAFFLRNAEQLPDFITREDLLNLLIIDPARMLGGIKFNENPALLERMGDINEFKKLLYDKKEKLEQAGMVLENSKILAVIEKLDSVEKTSEKLAHYTDTLEKISSQLSQMEKFLEMWEEKNHYQSQLDSFQNVEKYIDHLSLEESELIAFEEYRKKTLEAGEKNNEIDLSSAIDTIHSLKKQLEKQLTELKELKEYIQEKQNKKETPDPALQKTYDEIQEKIDEIEKARIRINFLKNYVGNGLKKQARKKEEKNEKEKEKKETPVEEISPEIKKVEKSPKSKKAMCYYLIIMTRKSILEGKPSTEYLKKLNSDPELRDFVNNKLSPKTKKLRKQVRAIEHELAIETAKKLKISSLSALANTEREYFSIDPATNKPHKEISPDNPPPYQIYSVNLKAKIQSELDACTDSYSHQRVNSYWIKVMQAAYDNKDQFTLSIIAEVITSQQTIILKDGKKALSNKSQEKLTELLRNSQSKEYLDNINKSIEDKSYTVVPDPSVLMAHSKSAQKSIEKGEQPSGAMKNYFINFLKCYDYIKKRCPIVTPEKTAIDTPKEVLEPTSSEVKKSDLDKTKEYADIESWLDDPQPEKDVSIVKLGEYIGHKVLEAINSGEVIINKRDNKSSLKKRDPGGVIANQLQKLPQCQDYKSLLSCINEIKKEVHFKNANELNEILLMHIQIKSVDALQAFDHSLYSSSENRNEEIAKNMITYLELVKAKWEIQKCNDKIPKKHKKQIEEMEKLIGQFILKLQHESLTLEQIDTDLKKLHADLKEKTKPPTGLSGMLYVFSSRSEEAKNSAKQLEEIQKDISSIESMETLIKNQFVDSSEETHIHQTTPRTEGVTPEEEEGLPLLHHPSPRTSVSHPEKKQADLDFPLSQDWEQTEVTPTTPSATSRRTSVTAPVSFSPGLPIPKPKEYVHKKNKAHIYEAQQNTLLKITVTKEPDYTGMSSEEKGETDLDIAESMVRLLVAQCGNSKEIPIHILDSTDTNRMRAFFVVCRAHGLEYLPPPAERGRQHDFITNPAILQSAVDKMSGEITAGSRKKVDPAPALSTAASPADPAVSTIYRPVS